MSVKKVVIIDDDEGILEALQLVLEDAGFEVFTERSGKYLDFIPHHMPDLILLDILISGEDGRVIAQKLKSQEKTKSIPIVMITAHPSANNISDYKADGFLAKPFDIEHLINVVYQFTAAKN